jgi:hypothetical protein
VELPTGGRRRKSRARERPGGDVAGGQQTQFKLRPTVTVRMKEDFARLAGRCDVPCAFLAGRARRSLSPEAFLF